MNQKRSSKSSKHKSSAKARTSYRATFERTASGKRVTSSSITQSKQEQILALMQRKGGASIDELMRASGWQAHSVRGVISGTIRRHLGLAVTSLKASDGIRRYRVEAEK